MDLRTILNDEQRVAPPPPPSPSSALPPPPAPHVLFAAPVFAVQPPLPLPLAPHALHKPLDLVLHAAWPPPPPPAALAALAAPLYAAPPPLPLPPRAVSPRASAAVTRAPADAPRRRSRPAKRPRAPLPPSRISRATACARNVDDNDDDDDDYGGGAQQRRRRRRRDTRRADSTCNALDGEQRTRTQNSARHLARVRGGASKQQRHALRRAFRSTSSAWRSPSPSVSRASCSASSSPSSSLSARRAPPVSSSVSPHALVDSAPHLASHAAMSTDECSVEEHIIDGVDSFGRCLRPAYSSTDDDDDDDSDVLIIDNNHSGQTTPCQPSTNRPAHSSSPARRSASPPPPHHTSLQSLSIQDPLEPYPVVSKHFDGVPSTAVGDMLQVWDFVTSFSKPLRLTPFKLWHFQQAIVHNSRCELIDACLLRLVQIIISDRALVNELDIPDTVIRSLTTATPRNAVDTILTELPNILLFESDDVDDHLLHITVQKLRHASRKEAFYKSIDPVGKCRVLRELVDYATMTDTLRHCVSTNLELAEEERKKAKEENSALRRKYENQLRELRTELLEYKLKHGMIEPPTGSTGDKKSPTLSTDPNSNEQKNCATGATSEIETDVVIIPHSNNNSTSNQSQLKNDSASGSTSREGHTTRKEKLLQAQRERKEAIERRAKERGAQAIVARMDKVRASLKSLKNIRLRRRKASDSFPVIEAHSDQQLHDRSLQNSVRTYPLGTDRDDRCYWFFSGSGRIWVEDTRDGDWFSLTTMKSVQNLLRWLSPHRIEERLLKKRLRQRIGLIEDEMQKEQKGFEMAEREATKERGVTPRTTRAGRRRANQEAKTKKNKTVTTFLDYQNLEI